MEIDLKKAFYFIVGLVLIAIVNSNVAQPVYNKFSPLKAKIEAVDFTGAKVETTNFTVA